MGPWEQFQWNLNQNAATFIRENEIENVACEMVAILSFLALMFSLLLANCCICLGKLSLQWRYNERNDVSNRQRHDCLLNRLFWDRSKKTSKLRVTGLCDRWPVNSQHKGPVTREMLPFDDVIMCWALSRWRSPNPSPYQSLVINNKDTERDSMKTL